MKLRRTLAIVSALIVSASVFSACSDSTGSSSSPAAETSTSAQAETTAPQEAPPAPEGYNVSALAATDKAVDEEALSESLTSVGNPTAMQAKMKKALAGEKTTVAYLGGSITEGFSAGPEKCYAKESFNRFKAAFGGGDNIQYVNAGISGTPSKLGNLRLQRDILSKDPDICFIEFAVNDARDTDHRAAYESIVRDLIEKDVAVVLLFSRTDSGYSAQDQMKEIGAYYNVPMISYADGLTYMLDNKKIAWSDFSSDNTHPNLRGHAIVADMICNYFKEAFAAVPEAYTYPTAPLSIMVQQGMQMFENKDIEPEDSGSWSTGSDVSFFKQGWTYDAKGDNKPLIFKFRGKFAHIVYKESNDKSYGKIKVKVTVDGEEYDTQTISSYKESGWGNPVAVQIGMQASEKDYVVEISMDKGCETDHAQILAIAHN